MIFYVSHKYEGDSDIDHARKITHDLQMQDLANCYICPTLALSHLKPGEITKDYEFAIRSDILQMCDKMIVASEQDELVKSEVTLARTLRNLSQEPIEVIPIEDEYRKV